MVRLIAYNENIIYRGHLLRCKGHSPYESTVDFLICESIDSESDAYQLIVASGYKAGLKFCQFPKESIPEGQRMGLKTEWLVNNWATWGYVECLIEEVFILESPVPDIEYPS